MSPGTAKHFGRFTVFLFESPNASELGGKEKEADLLAAACALAGHRFVAYSPLSKSAFAETLRYIFSTWEPTPGREDKPQFSIHLSVHGNGAGIQIGADSLSWRRLGRIIRNAQATTSWPFILTLSACGDADLDISSFKLSNAPPSYVFSFSAPVAWDEAALTWAVLYKSIVRVNTSDAKSMKSLVDRIRALHFGRLRYHRLDGSRYRWYPAR